MARPMLDKPQFVELLTAFGGSDNNTRKQAETLYGELKVQHAQAVMVMMLQILGAADVNDAVKTTAAVLLRKCVGSGDPKDFLWGQCARETQPQVAGELLRLFEQGGLPPNVQKKVGDVIAKLSEYVCDADDPRGHIQAGGAWPELLQAVYRMAAAGAVEQRECALRTIHSLVETMKPQILAGAAELQQLLQVTLAAPELKVQVPAFLVVCQIVCCAEKKEWQALMVTLPLLVGILQKCAGSDETLLQEAIEGFIEVAQMEPDFFKDGLKQGMEPATSMAGIAQKRDWADTGIRGLASEWLISYVEKRTKFVCKHLPTLPGVVLEVALKMMLEVEDGADALKTWAEKMDDEEGDEDVDEIYTNGEEIVDRVVSACEVENIGDKLFQVVAAYIGRPEWQAKHAGLAAIKQSIEYVEDKAHIAQCAQMLLSHVNHEHPRVRYTSLHALGQLANDQSPHFQESHHKEVMPILMTKMDDPVDRVAAMSMSAFVSFGEELNGALMLTYAGTFMEKVVAKLQTSKHRLVQEECITSIAVIAGVMEKDFVKYYDGIMPMLKQFIMNATGDQEKRLRGKSFECMSLLGVAVGKEKFLPDAREALSAMMGTTCEADDIQQEYIKEATERIVQCLKESFKEFLPHVLPKMLQGLQIKEDTAKPDDDDDDPYVTVMQKDGTTVNVRSSKFQEIQGQVELLGTMAREMKGGFAEFVQPTAEVLFPFLSNSDGESYLCDEVRSAALGTFAELIGSAKAGAEAGATALAEIPRALLLKCMEVIISKTMQEETDPDTLAPVAAILAECIKKAGPGCLQPAEVGPVVQQVFKLMNDSIQRSAELDKKVKDNSGPAAADDEGDDEEGLHQDETQLRQNYEEILGACMEVAPAVFCEPAMVQGLSQKLQEWLPNPKFKTLGLFLACDLVEKLKGQSVGMWPLFMPAVFQATADKDDDAATAAVYCITLAAPLAEFNQAAPEAFRLVGQIVAGKAPKKRDNSAKLKFDNAVAALLNLAKEKIEACPPEIPAFELCLKHLPIRHDEAEGKKVHESLVSMVLGQNAHLLGKDQANLGRIFSILAEVYHEESICEKATEEKILQVFKNIPAALLQQHAGMLTEKQQKKIEKMLTS